MAINIVAYAGVENFDNILYLSRILHKLEKKVLIVDHSETKALYFSVPQPQGVSCETAIITYRKVDFTSMVITPEIADSYDDILISYGFLEPEKDFDLCNRLIWVTDLYCYHYERKPAFSCTDVIHINQRFLLIKDVVETKFTPEMLIDHLEIKFLSENISISHLDEKDHLNGLVCHQNKEIQFRNISKLRSRYLIDEAGRLHPEINMKQRKAAYRKAWKGV
jgi:hypothetical protein